MKRPVIWSRDALDDVKAQVIFVARDDPAAARRIADTIRDVGAALGEMATGRPGRVSGTYEKSLVRLPYDIAYALRRIGGSERVVILRVIHTSRDWPDDEWPD